MSIETRETDACPHCRNGMVLDMRTLRWRACGCGRGSTAPSRDRATGGPADGQDGPVGAKTTEQSG